MNMCPKPSLFFHFFILSWCAAASPQVFCPNPPLFARALEPMEIHACADGQPDQVLLQWSSSQAEGLETMTRQPDLDCWTFRLPADQMQGEQIRFQILADYDRTNIVESPEYTVCLYSDPIPLPVRGMALQAKLLARHRWNENPDAFSLKQEPDGTVVGPAAIVCRNNQVHVLDTVKGRILSFDLQGRRKKQIPLPTQSASDLVIDPSDDSFLVISQAEDRVHRLRPGRPSQSQPLGVGRQLAFPAQFRYIPSTDTLMAKDGALQNRWTHVLQRNRKVFRQPLPAPSNDSEILAEVQDGKILVKHPRQQSVFVLSFESPVLCLEESVENSDGILWLLFTLEGDYRIRRLCRIDPERQTAQTAQIDVWFSFEATRRMDAADQGVVLLAGDDREARMILFDYQGELP